MPVYALVDGNNFYVSCERVFRPSLQGRPVVTPTADTRRIISATLEGLRRIFRPGFDYAKDGAMLMDLSSATQVQGEMDFGMAVEEGGFRSDALTDATPGVATSVATGPTAGVAARPPSPRRDPQRLMAAMDAVNQRWGKHTMKLGTHHLDPAPRGWVMKQERRHAPVHDAVGRDAAGAGVTGGEGATFVSIADGIHDHCRRRLAHRRASLAYEAPIARPWTSAWKSGPAPADVLHLSLTPYRAGGRLRSRLVGDLRQIPERVLPVRDLPLGMAHGAEPDDAPLRVDGGVDDRLVLLPAFEAGGSRRARRHLEVRRISAAAVAGRVPHS